MATRSLARELAPDHGGEIGLVVLVEGRDLAGRTEGSTRLLQRKAVQDQEVRGQPALPAQIPEVLRCSPQERR